MCRCPRTPSPTSPSRSKRLPFPSRLREGSFFLFPPRLRPTSGGVRVGSLFHTGGLPIGIQSREEEPHPRPSPKSAIVCTHLGNMSRTNDLPKPHSVARQDSRDLSKTQHSCGFQALRTVDQPPRCVHSVNPIADFCEGGRAQARSGRVLGHGSREERAPPRPSPKTGREKASPTAPISSRPSRADPASATCRVRPPGRTRRYGG